MGMTEKATEVLLLGGKSGVPMEVATVHALQCMCECVCVYYYLEDPWKDIRGWGAWYRLGLSPP